MLNITKLISLLCSLCFFFLQKFKLISNDFVFQVTFFVQESSRIKGGISSSFTFNELNCVVGLQLPNFTGIADRVFTEFGIGSNKSKSFHVSYLRPLYSFDRAIYKASVFQNISQRPMAGFKLLEQGSYLFCTL